MTNIFLYRPNLLNSTKHIAIAAKPIVRLPAKVIINKNGKKVVAKPTNGKTINKSVQIVKPDAYKMPTLDVLEARYERLSISQKPLYDSVNSIHYIMGAIFESKTAFGTVPYPNNTYDKYDSWENKGADNLRTQNRFMDIGPNFVQTIMNLSNYEIRLNVGDTDKTALNSAVALIRNYIPNFTLPTSVENVERESEGGKRTRRALIGLKGQSLMGLAKLAKMRPNYVPKSNWLGPNYPQVTPAYTDIIKSLGLGPDADLVSLEFTVEEDRCYLERDSIDNPKIVLGNGQQTIVINIQCRAIFSWPLNFALYVTSASSPKTFYPALFMQYLSEHRKSVVKNLGKKREVSKAPARVNHYGNIKAMIEQEGPRSPIAVNEDNFLILGSSEPAYSGQVVWIPPADDHVDEYLTHLKESYDPEQKLVVISKATAPKNMGLFTDHNSEKFSYLNGEGNIEVRDLTGSVPLDDITILRDLRKPIVGDKQFFEELDKAIFQLDPQWITNYASESNDSALLKEVSYYRSISNMYHRLLTGTAEITWGEIGVGGFGNNYKVEEQLCAVITAASNYVLKNFDKIDIAYSTKIMYTRYKLLLITKYCKKIAVLTELYTANTEVNSAAGVALDNKKVKVTNLPGLTYLMPHQVRAQNKLSTNPFSIVIDVSVGGGKCLEGSTMIPTTKGLLKLSELRKMSGGINKSDPGFRAFDNTQVASFNADDKINMTYSTKGSTVRLRTSIGDELEGLKEHKFWKLQADGSVGFTSINDIKVGDWLPKQIGTRIFSNTVPKLPRGCNQLIASKLTPELARILGFLVTEGHVKHSGLLFTNSCEQSLAQYDNDWNATFTYELSKTKEKHDLNNNVYTHTYSTYSVGLVKLFAEIGLPIVKSAKKEVPWVVRQAPENLQLQFLKAAFEGDGGIHNPDIDKNRWRVEYYSISKQLAYQIKYMLENIGIASSLIRSSKRTHKTAANGVVTYSEYKTCYIVQIAQQYISLFADKIGFISTNKTDKLMSCLTHKENEDLKGCDANERNYNHKVHGFVNYLPVGVQLNQATSIMEEIIRPFKFLTDQGMHCVLSLSRSIHIASGYHNKPYGNYRQSHANTVATWKTPEVVATRYTIDRFIKCVEDAPADIKEALFADTRFMTAYSTITDAVKYIWAQVKFKKSTGLVKPVYDLSIPGSNAYVANGYMSHNTSMLLADLARLLADGKIKRAMIICPNKLVRSWVTEINKFSNGELNPFPITREGLRRLNTMINPKKSVIKPDIDNKVLKQLMDKMPPNTVFVVGLSFLSRGSNVQQVLYGTHIIQRYKMSEFFKEFGFDWIGIDESQKVKNLNSSQTEAASVLVTGAKFKRLASGTIVDNTPTDLVGQTSMLNPAIFGRTKEFRDNYNLNPTVASSPLRSDAPKEMAIAMLPYTSRFTAKKRDWAFALPRLHTSFPSVELTHAQEIYYNAQLDKAMESILNDPKIQNLLADPDPDKREAAAKFLSIHFQKVEQFLCAPDSVPLFAEQTSISKEDIEKQKKNAATNRLTTDQYALTPEDLISPKVKAVDIILHNHFDGIKEDKKAGIEAQEPNKFKVLIFSFRKVTPEHIFKNLDPRWQKMARVYTVDRGMKPITDFMKNDKIQILIANESSIKEGFNLQMASRLIKLESVWNPGGQEQAIGRIYRPSDEYKRSDIYLDYVMINNTLEVAKFGRLISKQIDKMRYDEEDNPNFNKKPYGPRNLPISDQLSSLELIKMGLDTIKNYSTTASIRDYISSFGLIENWEQEQFDKLRAQKLGVIKIDDSQRQTITGSKNLSKTGAWLPRVEGAEPLNSNIMQPVSIIESRMQSEADEIDDDEEDDSEVEVNPVKIKQLVDTEFGLGYVLKIQKNDLVVNVPGITVPVKVPKSTTYVFISPTAENEALLRLKKAGKRGLARIPGVTIDYSEADKPLALPAPAKNKDAKNKDDAESPIIKPEPEKVVKKLSPAKKLEKLINDDEDTDTDDDHITVTVDIMNGSIVVMVAEEDVDPEYLADFRFRHLPQYAAISIFKQGGVKAVIDAIRAKGFSIDQSMEASLLEYGKLLGQHKLGTISQEYYASNVHYLNIKTFKPLVNKDSVKLYPLVVYNHTQEKYQLQLMTNLKQQPKIRRLIGKPLVSTDIANKFHKDGPFLARVLRTKAEALVFLKRLGKTIDIYEYDDLLDHVKHLKSK